MRIQKKSRILALMLALLMSLSACGGNTQSPASSATEPNTPTGTAVPSASTLGEGSADITVTEGTPGFFTINGLSYPTELGMPVLVQRAAELAASAAPSSAAEQITNVGDAICYLQSVNVFRFSYEGLFGEMILYNTSLRVPSVFPMVSSIHLKKRKPAKNVFYHIFHSVSFF